MAKETPAYSIAISKDGKVFWVPKREWHDFKETGICGPKRYTGNVFKRIFELERKGYWVRCYHAGWSNRPCRPGEQRLPHLYETKELSHARSNN